MKSRPRGQILLPGLAVFTGLMLLFIGLLGWGVSLLQQMRLECSAEAVALSAARAQAQILNNAASHNLMINGFVNLRYNGLGAMQKAAVKPFRLWLELQNWERKRQGVLSGFLGYPVAVGRVIARLNGIEDNAVWNYPLRLSPQLILKDLFVIFLNKFIPAGGENFEEVYYARTWHLDQRKAQPTHVMTWYLSRGRQGAAASARVYLDVRPDERLQNGGFPRVDEDWLGNLEIQSFHPQFNAQLIPTRGEARLLESLHRTRG